MAPAPTSEPIVQERQSMPHGYVFVPKGNVFITGHCRRRTQAANHTVYTVVDASSRKKTLGIRVPQTIYTSVRQSEAATRQDRANAVKKRDGALETQFCEEVLRLFPNIPSEAVPKVVQTAMRKGSGRVGRTGALGLEKRAILGVRAHIRHCETAYDGLLKNGMTRERAREKVIGRVDEVAGQWVGKQKKEGAESRRRCP
ncbi:uncharacterized protein BCR38DRAFT_453643 [Pseudomassariella vexata]|uniref:DUF2293 domain-containing protein n=1 Tax=Pseudomassariella vexata TaxID=1141098 RepID=A0A1Y2EIC3_9PEZI|nr:uncharacterized protein BCR38DRAFT_453643 [Pseudomassariella vexata]ORY70976.1 hypothetical protein BCR38DRAFT_453643 [Pseudomassariella vexata]